MRERKIVSLLDKLKVVDVELFMMCNVDGLGNTSRRNVLRVLNRMVEDGILDEKRIDVKMYCLKGVGFGYWEHRLLMNKFIVGNGLLNRVRIEPLVSVKGVEFRPDFIVPIVSKPQGLGDWKFYEVDRRQKRKVNHEKIERYKRLGLKFEVVCERDRNYMWKGCVINNV